ncbi:MAG: XylR family transcriptional regulator [Opitutales bacterium]|nr:XylR family transcriptional regulator [Opitutales bacterium]
MIESSRGSGRSLIQGIAEYLRGHGPWSFYWEPRGMETALPVLREMDVDGIILRDTDMLDHVLSLKIPAIVVGHHRSEVPNFINVITDSPNIGKMGAQHLIGCGFRHFAFCGLESLSWSDQRRTAFSDCIRQSGFGEVFSYSLSLHPHHNPANTRQWESERQQMAEWLKKLPKPLGLMACNDDCGAEVMEACKLANLQIPDTVGVLGADNDEIVCGLADPPMSSIVLNFEKAGFESARILDALIRNRDAGSRRIDVVSSHVVARRSTDFVATEDANVARALQFIRDEAVRGLSVMEVAEHAGVSRRALERRFRSLLGRSVLKEIRRVRAEHIANLLVETHMPIGEIAELMGFSDPQHISRYFKAVKEMSPQAYRKAYLER